MSGNMITKSLWTETTEGTVLGTPASGDLILYAPQPGTRLVTDCKHATVASLIAGGLDLPLIATAPTQITPGNFDVDHSAIVLKNADGSEISRLVFGDPDVADFNAFNVYIGFEAAKNATHNNSDSGYWNVGIGGNVFHELTTGQNNVAVGYNSFPVATTADFNVAVGSFALFADLTGDGNVALGANGLVNLTTGANNTAIGRNAGATLTTGSGNIMIAAGTAHAAEPSAAGASDELNIGGLIKGVFGTSAQVVGTLDAAGYKVGVAVGKDGSFTTVDGKTVTVTKGIITDIV